MKSKRRVLTRDVFAIMVALAAGRQTGREIQRRVVGDTAGLFVPDSIVYEVLHRMVEDGQARAAGRVYELTEQGVQRLKFESGTYESLVEKARQRVG